MTESLTDPRASQSFVIVTAAQLQALNDLLFLLIRSAHTHASVNDSHHTRDDARKMHELLDKWIGSRSAGVGA